MGEPFVNASLWLFSFIPGVHPPPNKAPHTTTQPRPPCSIVRQWAVLIFSHDLEAGVPVHDACTKTCTPSVSQADMPSGCYSQSLNHQAATANHADTADRVPQSPLRAPEVTQVHTGIDLDVKASNRETMGLPLIVPSGSEQLDVHRSS